MQQPLPLVELEPLRVEHAVELYETLKHPGLYTYVPQNPPTSVESLRAQYAFMLDPASSPDGETWLNWVMRLQPGSEPAGLLQATIGTEYAAIAYSVLPCYWRKGIAFEGCRRLLSELAKNWGVCEARAWVDSRNEASIGLLEKLGFNRIEFIKAADEFKGSVSDEFVYALNLNFPPVQPNEG